MTAVCHHAFCKIWRAMQLDKAVQKKRSKLQSMEADKASTDAQQADVQQQLAQAHKVEATSQAEAKMLQGSLYCSYMCCLVYSALSMC